MRDRAFEACVDDLGDAARRGEIGVVQHQADAAHLVELEADFALDDGAGGDAPRGRNALGHRRALALGGEAARGDGALRDRVNLAIGAEQRRHQQGAALQALGIAERRDLHVDAATLAGEGRQGARHHHRRDIGCAQAVVAGIDAEPLEHADQAFAREDRLIECVAGAVEADHQAIAHQHVVAHALEIGDVLDARGGEGGLRRGTGGGERERGENEAGQAAETCHGTRCMAYGLFRRARCQSRAKAKPAESPAFCPRTAAADGKACRSAAGLAGLS